MRLVLRLGGVIACPRFGLDRIGPRFCSAIIASARARPSALVASALAFASASATFCSLLLPNATAPISRLTACAAVPRGTSAPLGQRAPDRRGPPHAFGSTLAEWSGAGTPSSGDDGRWKLGRLALSFGVSLPRLPESDYVGCGTGDPP